MALDFPLNPVEGQTYSAEGTSWKFTSGVWVVTTGTAAEYLLKSGGTLTGPLVIEDTLSVQGGTTFDSQVTFRNAAAVFNAGLRTLADIVLRWTGNKFIRFQDAAGSDQGLFGWDAAKQQLTIATGGQLKFETTPTGISMPLDLDVVGNITMGGDNVLTEADLDSELDGYLPLSGGILTGALSVQGSFVAALDGYPQIQLLRSGNAANSRLTYVALNADGDIQFNHRNDDTTQQNIPVSMRRDGNVEISSTLLIGTTETAGPASNGFDGININGSNKLISMQRSGGSALQVGRGEAGGVAVWYQNSNTCGTVSVSGGNSTNYGTSSDPRMKDDYQPIDISLFDQIKVYDFKWTVGEGRGMGVRSDELQPVVPSAVIGTVNEVDDDGNPVYMSVDYAKLVPLLIAKMQSQDEIINMLNDRLSILES